MSRKAQEFSEEEFKAMEAQLLKDIAILIHKASTAILESKILVKFYQDLDKRTPTDAQIKALKKQLFECIVSKHPKFEDAIELIVERDEDNDKLIGIELNPKKIKIKADPGFMT